MGRDASYSMWTHAGCIVIVDLVKIGHKTVTNDAENVVARAVEEYGDLPVFYRDSLGDYGQLLHIRGKFIGFQDVHPRGNKARILFG